MNDFKNEWEASYINGDNNILYPQSEVIKFLNRYICKRNNDETFTRIINKNSPNALRGLDFACGIGTHAITFRDFKIESFGIDISEFAISIAKKRIENSLENYIQFNTFTDDTCRIPYRDNYFDFVVAESCLDSMPTEIAKKYILELKRVTNGLIYASFIGKVPDHNIDECVIRTKKEFGTFQVYFNVEKIVKLLGINQEDFLQFYHLNQINSINNTLMSKRYYCIFKSCDVGSIKE
jgi:ubiquinone/menaquinone biosynthesis C-methylase UbiE